MFHKQQDESKTHTFVVVITSASDARAHICDRWRPKRFGPPVYLMHAYRVLLIQQSHTDERIRLGIKMIGFSGLYCQSSWQRFFFSLPDDWHHEHSVSKGAEKDPHLKYYVGHLLMIIWTYLSLVLLNISLTSAFTNSYLEWRIFSKWLI